MKTYNIITAHTLCSQHREQLIQSKCCGCFYCGKIFNPKELVDWCDEGETAICPYCSVDSILPEQEGLILSKQFLQEMHNHWF